MFRRTSTPWYHPRSIWRSVILRPRLYLAITTAVATWLALAPLHMAASAREALTWIAGGLVYLTAALRTMRTSSPAMIARYATRNDDSRLVIMVLILLAIGSSLGSIFGLLGVAKAAAPNIRPYYVGLAVAAIVVSWSVMQVVFTLHYANTHYRPSPDDPQGTAGAEHPDAKPRATKPLDPKALDPKPLDPKPLDPRSLVPKSLGGLAFPGEPNPDYWDFLYFATSIGATSQTSDVSIRSRALRRLATVHAVVSFFFNAAVLALLINLAAGLL